MEIPTTKPEPLTIVTALSSMKAINSIFREQIQFYAQFEPIIVSAPFYLIDDDSFKKEVFAADEKRPLIVDEIKEIHKYADGNIQCYETKIEPRIETKRAEGTIEKYYTIHPKGAMTALPMAKEWIMHPDNQQRQWFMFLFTFYDFCKEVHKITSRFLSEPDSAGRHEIPILSRITKYISFKFMGEEAESRYQLVSKIQESVKPNIQIYRLLHTEKDINITFTKFIESELEQHFFAFMQRSTCIEFLQYHLSKYLETNPGDEAVFFDFILDLIGCKYLDMTKGNDITDWPLTTLPKSRIDEITKWIYRWKQPARKVVKGTEPEPAKVKPKPTVAQIALFFHYLSKGKVLVPPPGSSFFRIDKMHKQPPYNFDVSGQKIYLYYGVMNEKSKNKTFSIDDVMNVKNLKAVIPMLKKHPAAHKIAKFELSSLLD